MTSALRRAAIAGLPLLSLGVVGVLLHALGRLPPEQPGVAPLVQARLEAAGAENPVTAVLMNFRAMDTLLEVSVLLAAAVAVFLLRPLGGSSPTATEPISLGPRLTPMLQWYVRRLLTAAVLVAICLVWAGGHEPGGAFQAGALLGGAAALALLSGMRPPRTGTPLRLTMVFGPAAFTLAGLVAAIAGRGFLAYPQGWAKGLIPGLEVALAISIAAALAELVVGVPPRRRP